MNHDIRKEQLDHLNQREADKLYSQITNSAGPDEKPKPTIGSVAMSAIDELDQMLRQNHEEHRRNMEERKVVLAEIDRLTQQANSLSDEYDGLSLRRTDLENAIETMKRHFAGRE